MRARRASVLLAVLPLLLLACGGAPPPVTNADRVWQVAGNPLAIATDTYNEALRAVGRAHARHQITDAQLAEVLVVAEDVRLALRTARAALIAYATARDPSAEHLALAVGVAQDTLEKLLVRLGALGVQP